MLADDDPRGASTTKATEDLIALSNEMGHEMQEIVAREPRVHVYSFETPREVHGEVSRLIAKLRDARTEHPEFVYYTQRAYELLFNFAFGSSTRDKKNHIVVRTPVTLPVQNFAVHKIPDVDERIENAVMCVMLRGALLPAMIMSKEIQEYSSHGYVTPFALFKISRDDTKEEGEHGVRAEPRPLVLRPRRPGRKGPVLRGPHERHGRQPRHGREVPAGPRACGPARSSSSTSSRC